jgi:hypothetical protein
VVDNFEQVAEAAPLLEDLLTAAPRLKVLVASRVVVVVALRGEPPALVAPRVGGDGHGHRGPPARRLWKASLTAGR